MNGSSRARNSGYLAELTDEERYALIDHIEEGYLQAERGELMDSEEAKKQIEIMKENWRHKTVSDPSIA